MFCPFMSRILKLFFLFLSAGKITLLDLNKQTKKNTDVGKQLVFVEVKTFKA